MPQAILECSSNYTPILSTDVGFSRQILNENSICKNQQEFVKKIKSKDFDLTDHNYQKLQDYNMEKVMENVFNESN